MANKTIDDLFNDSKYQNLGSNFNSDERDRIGRITDSNAAFKLSELAQTIDNASRMALPVSSQKIFGADVFSKMKFGTDSEDDDGSSLKKVN